jgi:hypothetical protein
MMHQNYDKIGVEMDAGYEAFVNGSFIPQAHEIRQAEEIVMDEEKPDVVPEMNGTDGAKRYTFSRGEYQTGQLPVSPVSAPPVAASVSEVKPSVAIPESAPERIQTFAEMMGNAEEAKVERPWSWEAQTQTQKFAYIAGGISIGIVFFVALTLGLNILAPERTSIMEPTASAASQETPAVAGAFLPTEAVSLVSVSPVPTAGAVTSGCDGFQYYHSPDEADVGPCVLKSDAVVPAGTYGTDGVWIFMILPSGEMKWIKASAYGYTAAQVQAMKLKDFQVIAQAPIPTAEPYVEPPYNPGIPPENTPVPPPSATPVPPATPDPSHGGKPGRDKPTRTGSKSRG